MVRQSKKSFQDRYHSLLASLILKVGRIVARFSDRTLITILSLIEKLLRKKNPDHPSLLPVGEIKDIFENSPEGNRVVRDILKESRKGQVLSFLKGTFRHYGNPRALPFHDLDEQLRDSAHKEMKIGIIGKGYDLQIMGEQYSRIENCTIVPFSESLDFDQLDNFLSRVDALEIGGVDDSPNELLEKAVQANIALSLHYSMLQTSLKAKEIYRILGRSKRPVRILYPPEFYPPVRMVRTLIENEEVGEITMVRVRATLGKNENGIAPAPFGDDILSHNAFDHLPMLVYFGGNIEKVGAYINPMDKERGGQALVDVKYLAPGCYGLLDCTFAPHMSMRTNHLPYDLEAEITGTDGVIWLRRGMSCRNATEPIYVRIGQTSYSIGIESGMDLEYESAYANAAKQFYASFLDIQYPMLGKNDFISAVQTKEKAHESNKSKKVLSL